jgi:hypothetical protein
MPAMPENRQHLQQRIAAELAHLAQLGPMLKGTVCKIQRRPRKRGVGERIAYLLTYKGPGNKTRSVYVPANRVAEVQDMIARHREAVRALDHLVDLSVRLFKQKPPHHSSGSSKRLA